MSTQHTRHSGAEPRTEHNTHSRVHFATWPNGVRATRWLDSEQAAPTVAHIVHTYLPVNPILALLETERLYDEVGGHA